MALSILQSKVSPITSGSATRVATFDSACTVGSRIVAVVLQEYDLTGSSCTVADGVNAGNYTRRIQADNTTPVTLGDGSIHDIVNTSSSALTVTATFGISHPGIMVIYELSSGSSYDSSGSNIIDPIAAPPSVNVTTVLANCAVFSGALHLPSWTGGDTGYTVDVNQVGDGSYYTIENKTDVGATGLKTLNWAGQADSTLVAVVAAYAPPVTDILFAQSIF